MKRFSATQPQSPHMPHATGNPDRYMARLLSLGFAVLSVPTLAHAADDIWMLLTIGGNTAGNAHFDRRVIGNRVFTRQRLTLSASKDGSPLTFTQSMYAEESSRGVPLALDESTQFNQTLETARISRRADGRYVRYVGKQLKQLAPAMQWPKQALLAEGQRQAMIAAGSRNGARYEYRQFDGISGTASTLHGEVLGWEDVALPEGVMRLVHHRQWIEAGGVEETQDTWINSSGSVMRQAMTFLGKHIEMLACSKSCALSQGPSVDLFRLAVAASPRALTPAEKQHAVRYHIHLRTGASALPEAAEQEVTRNGPGDWDVLVRPSSSASSALPGDDTLKPNAWVQSDSLEVRALAATVANSFRSAEAMQQLVRLTAHTITSPEEGGDGYASASEAIRSHKGDCSEYAVLLAALGRAKGIPTRVVFGLVYVDHYGQQQHVFVPHAWVHAWIDGRWRSYDAALGHFDTSHIALATGVGTPSSMGASGRLLGLLQITSITILSDSDNAHRPPSGI